MTITIKEGMQDTHMYMWEDFKSNVASVTNSSDMGLTRKDAAMLVAYRERSSVLDHRLAMIAEQLEKIDKNLQEAGMYD